LSFHYQLILFALLLTSTYLFQEDSFLFQLDMFPSLSKPIFKKELPLQVSNLYLHIPMSHCLNGMTEHLRHLIVIALIIIIIEKYKDIKLTLTDKGQKAAASQKEQNI